MQVAQAAFPTLGQTHLLSVFGQVRYHFARFRIGKDRPHWNPYRQIIARLAIASRTAPVFALLGFENAGVAKLDEGVDIAIRHSKNTAAAPAISAIGAAPGNIFLTAKRRTAIAPLAGIDFNLCFVDKLHPDSLLV